MNLTTPDLDQMSRDGRWLGFGYLGERRNHRAHSPETVALVDEEVIRLANLAGLDYEGLFAWANSKDGRWYGDLTFGQATGHAVAIHFERARRYGPR